MIDRWKILYVGPDFRGSNATSWRDAFLELGHEVTTVDSSRLIPAPVNFIDKFAQKLTGRPPLYIIEELNKTIVRVARELRPDFTFYIHAHFILSETLEATSVFGPNVVYFNDDMFNRQNQSPTFLETIRMVECILTTNPLNVPEFLAAGAAAAIYIPFSYDPRIHYPAIPNAEERAHYRGDVTFIGTFRAERADFLSQLGNCKAEFQLGVWGDGWSKMNRPLYCYKWTRWRPLRSALRHRVLWCEELGKCIQSSKVILGLLNHANRDLHTYRTFEIPACGGFLLAERTDLHRQLFEEDKEAVYFSTVDELLDKIRFYLAHEQERHRIAAAGYERCLISGYRYVDRAKCALEQIEKIRPMRAGV